MIELTLLCEYADDVRASQRACGADPAVVDAVLAADQRRREAVGRADTVRAEQKHLGKQIGKVRGDEREALLIRGKELAAEVKRAKLAQTDADEALRAVHKAPAQPHRRRGAGRRRGRLRGAGARA